MTTKLTLRLDENLIRSAKRYSGKSGKSISRLVSDYFALIEAVEAADPERSGELTSRVRSLFGVLAGTSIDESDYHRYLETKHR